MSLKSGGAATRGCVHPGMLSMTPAHPGEAWRRDELRRDLGGREGRGGKDMEGEGKTGSACKYTNLVHG